MLARPLAMALALCPLLPAQAPIVDPAGLPGTRVLVGGGRAPAAVYQRFLELAGGPAKARIVLIPTASESANEAKERDEVLARWRTDHPGFAFELLHTRERTLADDEAFTAPLRAATGVWLGGGAQENLAKAYLGTRVEQELQALLARGGVVGGTSAGTAIQTRTMIQEGRDPPVMAQGFDFVPFAISDQHFSERQRLPRLLQALALRPGHFGLGVDEGTAAVISGRTIEVLGAGKVALVLAARGGLEQRIVDLATGERADLVTWQRAARDRAQLPEVALQTDGLAPQYRGNCVLVGGGRVPEEAAKRFVALAGGARARIVLVPGAAPREQRRADPFASVLKKLGVADVRELDCAHPREVTAEKLAVLADATALWFGGGRQWRLVDAFEGTPAVDAFRAVLARGGVVGGTSAGATIQGSFLVRGNPLGNQQMWCEGYDRGFGFLPVAIDQHFLARDRERDLTALIACHRHGLPGPPATGLGIDEGTAAIVQDGMLEVVGASKVAIVEPRGDGTATTWLVPGERWDLRTGKRP
jgi:cyanophycinase